ncbi:MAG: ribosomal RNA small subunit methyltransferase A [Nitrospirae bacterium]|nr:ribosomal RNA small subunit methyltransferase A [Nitrospirota bacterium]
MPNKSTAPKKHLGQNFLKDELLIEKIVEVANITKDDRVIEIGPGKGALTFRLAEKAMKVLALEIDHELYEYLEEKAQSYPNLTVLEEDVLKFRFETIESRFKIVANIPYYISTPIIFKLMESQNKIIDMTIMLQKELANRIVASPNCKDWGILSIAVQYNAIPSIELEIPRDAFFPSPKVDSAVVKIVPRKYPAVRVSNENLFWAIIKSAFSHRRKTLLNSLAMAGFKKESLEEILGNAGIDFSVRPENLSIEDWGKIVDDLTDHLEYQKMRKSQEW